MLKDGTVLFAEDRAIRAWRPSNTVDTHAELPLRIVSIGLAGPDHLLAVLEDDTAWLVDLATQCRVDRTESIGTTARRKDDPQGRAKVALSLAADTGTLVIPYSGGVQVIDAPLYYTWTLAEQPPSQSLYDPSDSAYLHPRISADGTRVIAQLADRSSSSLVTWSITVPTSPAETAQWVESLTNAAIDSQRSQKLIWR